MLLWAGLAQTESFLPQHSAETWSCRLGPPSPRELGGQEKDREGLEAQINSLFWSETSQIQKSTHRRACTYIPRCRIEEKRNGSTTLRKGVSEETPLSSDFKECFIEKKEKVQL